MSCKQWTFVGSRLLGPEGRSRLTPLGFRSLASDFHVANKAKVQNRDSMASLSSSTRFACFLWFCLIRDLHVFTLLYLPGSML